MVLDPSLSSLPLSFVLAQIHITSCFTCSELSTKSLWQELRDKAAEASHWQRRWHALEHQCTAALNHAVSALGKHGISPPSPCKDSGAQQDISQVMDEVLAKLKVPDRADWWPLLLQT